jgi:carboxymethylenebutenolidase
MAYLAATEMPLSCSVVYYGGGITQILDKKPKCPMMYHFGERDKHITQDDVAQIKAANPEGQFYLYPADHGFNCDQRGSYDAPSAALARTRTLEFFAQYVAAEKPKTPIA